MGSAPEVARCMATEQIRPLTGQQRSAILRAAMLVIETEYASHLTLDGVAREIATSRRQLQRCFQEHEDDSFRSCVRRVRLERAAHLLCLDSQARVKDVARAVGYRQPATFAKAFRTHYGVLPSAYRLQQLGDPAAQASASP